MEVNLIDIFENYDRPVYGLKRILVKEGIITEREFIKNPVEFNRIKEELYKLNLCPIYDNRTFEVREIIKKDMIRFIEDIVERTENHKE